MVHFREHLKQQVGVRDYYFAPDSTQSLAKLGHFLKVVGLCEQAFPTEPLPLADQIDVKHLPQEVFEQATQLLGQWFPLGEELDEKSDHISYSTFYQDWWEEGWDQLENVCK